jgi:hypothetical protein
MYEKMGKAGGRGKFWGFLIFLIWLVRWLIKKLD